MGEIYQIVAPEKKEYLPIWYYKLGQLLFEDFVSGLILNVLIVPEVALNAEEEATEEEKGEEYDACELATTIHHDDRLGQGSQYNDTSQFPANDLYLRTREAAGQETDGNHASNVTDAASDTASDAFSLSTLPVEILRLILDHLESYEDWLRLGFVNFRLFDFCRQEIQGLITNHSGAWAGTKLVCVGEYTKPGDYPPGLFSQEEKDSLRDVRVDRYLKEELEDLEERFPDYYRDVPKQIPLTLYHFGKPQFGTPRQTLSLPETIHHLNEAFEALPASAGKTLMSKVLERYMNAEAFIPEDQEWILRNRTTKEIVRAEAIALEPEDIHGPYIDSVGFGQVVLMRICWSSEGKYLTNKGDIARGAWAGHRLDIVTLARHRKQIEATGEEWTDVSQEIAEEVAFVGRSEFGDLWPRVHSR